jgi:hypothetical protein
MTNNNIPTLVKIFSVKVNSYKTTIINKFQNGEKQIRETLTDMDLFAKKKYKFISIALHYNSVSKHFLELFNTVRWYVVQYRLV